ncbi:MAG: hypothetical protein KGL36_09310 [Gammaproteobacteria bacterium]|nr:hypothetical protein [Gammaproteobacteria bacterium]
MNDRIRTLAVIQHDSAEYLGLIEDHLEGRRIRFRYFRPFTTDGRLPGSAERADGLVLLGAGPWGGAPGPHRLPTFEPEVALTADALARGVPILAIGLGALILCVAGGGTVESAPLSFEIDLAERTAADALDGYLPERFPSIRYGRDRPHLPPAARVLAVDATRRPALFRIGARAFGFAGHPGIKTAMIEDLIMEFPESPPDPGPALARLRTMNAAIEGALVPTMTGLVRCLGWMEPDGPGPEPGSVEARSAPG